MYSSGGLEANKALKSPLNEEIRNTYSIITCGNRPMGDTAHDLVGLERFVDAPQRCVTVTPTRCIYFLAFGLRAILKLFYSFFQYKTSFNFFEVQLHRQVGKKL